jgi:MerR family transcriptional regulator, copper efflux regulator
LAVGHLDRITEKIEALEAMRDTLTDLVRTCHGDDRPDCPILKNLASASRG